MALAEPVPAVVAGIMGSLLGSFLNVCVYRLPRDESVIRPRSRCPACGRPIAWYDNVPVLSYVLLQARCRHCGAVISVQYPIVELAIALVWAGAVAWHGPSVAALSAALLATLLVGIALTDARHYVIPDEFSLGGLGAGLALAVAPGGIAPLEAVIGAALGFGILWVAGAVGTWALKQDAMGGGDLKMMAMVGSFLGWRGVLLTIFLGAAAGTAVYAPLLLRKPRPLVPFGVFLAVGAFLTAAAGDRLVAWYVALLSRP